MRTSLALAAGGAGILMLGTTLAIIGKVLELEHPARSQGAVAWGVVLVIIGLALGASAAVTILSDPSVHPPAGPPPRPAGQAPAASAWAPPAGPAWDPAAYEAAGSVSPGPDPAWAAQGPDLPWNPPAQQPWTSEDPASAPAPTGPQPAWAQHGTGLFPDQAGQPVGGPSWDQAGEQARGRPGIRPGSKPPGRSRIRPGRSPPGYPRPLNMPRCRLGRCRHGTRPQRRPGRPGRAGRAAVRAGGITGPGRGAALDIGARVGRAPTRAGASLEHGASPE